jgi:hypothetical protein
LPRAEKTEPRYCPAPPLSALLGTPVPGPRIEALPVSGAIGIAFSPTVAAAEGVAPPIPTEVSLCALAVAPG